MSLKNSIFVAAGLALGIVLPASAATTVKFVLNQQGQGDVKQTAYIDSGKALIVSAGGDPDIDLLFQKSDESMTIINHSEQTTLAIDAEKVARLAGQASGMMDLVRQQLQVQMEGMSDQQREQLRQMLEGMGGGQLMQAPAPQLPRQFKQSGVATINGFTCSKTEVFQGNQKIAELCTSPADVLNIPEADYAVIEAMRDMSQKLRDETTKISNTIGHKLPQFGESEVAGVPIRMVDGAGNTMSVSQIQAGIGDAVLAIPADYSVKELPALPQLGQ